MAAELSLLSLTRLTKNNTTSSASMWNPNHAHDDDDSWEVRAFEEDARNVMGATWPPRSYTCTFCRREFRSAQALGGHMNVHRRDRARLNQTPPIVPNSSSSSTSTSSSNFIIPTQEFSTNGGLCLLYQSPNPNSRFPPASSNGCPNIENSPSTLLSIPQYPHSYHHHHHQVASLLSNSSQFFSNSKAEPLNSAGNSSKEFASEEVDLELRLGNRSTSSPSSPYKHHKKGQVLF